MIRLKKILCPVDFSESSDHALKYAVFLAKSHGATLRLLHVIEHLHGLDHYMILALTPQEIAEKMKREARRQLRAIASEVKEEVKLETSVQEGKAFLEIIGIAKEIEADLIVMGSHGRTGLQHILMGSVAEKVTRKAPCPVLIVRTRQIQFEMP